MARYKEFGKIILSLLVSFVIVSFVSNYFGNSKNFDFKKFTGNGKNLIAGIPNLFRINLNLSSQNLTPQNTHDGAPIDYTSDSQPPVKPTFTNPNIIIPTEPPCTGQLCLTPTIYNPQPTAINQPTNIPIPTKTPKPTKAPDVFPIDPSLARQGTTTDEVFNIASQKTCVPKEVLKGIAYIESGSFFDVVSPKYFLLYNSFNWWKSQFLTDVSRACGGYDYASNTGIIPADSNFAGQTCSGGQGGDLVAMGPLSVSDYWEGKYKKPAASALGVAQTDQRVILDAIAIVGMSVKDNVKPANCSSWTAHEVAKAACSYYGSCGFKDGTYYCNTFCRNYVKFGGKTACQTAVNQMQDNCWQ